MWLTTEKDLSTHVEMGVWKSRVLCCPAVKQITVTRKIILSYWDEDAMTRVPAQPKLVKTHLDQLDHVQMKWNQSCMLRWDVMEWTVKVIGQRYHQRMQDADLKFLLLIVQLLERFWKGPFIGKLKTYLQWSSAMRGARKDGSAHTTVTELEARIVDLLGKGSSRKKKNLPYFGPELLQIFHKFWSESVWFFLNDPFPQDSWEGWVKQDVCVWCKVLWSFRCFYNNFNKKNKKTQENNHRENSDSKYFHHHSD